MTRRRTQRDRREDFESLDRSYWTYFRERLEKLETFEEARELAMSGPGPDEPGRAYHSNLAFFLGQFTVPNGSGEIERALYLAFVRRLDAAGKLKPGSLALVEANFRRAAPSYRL